MNQPYAATVNDLAKWTAKIAEFVATAQRMSAMPHEQRQFPLLRTQDVQELTKVDPRRWQEYVQTLSADGRPVTTSGGHIRPTLAQVQSFMEHRGIRPRRPEQIRRAARIAISQFKGGASKTTLTLNLGVALARMGWRVLMVDLDPQATLTECLAVRGIAVEADETFVAAIPRDLSVKPSPLPVRKTYISGLDLVPAGLPLGQIEHAVSNRVAAGWDTVRIEQAFDAAFASVDANYDVVLVDSQPAFSFPQTFVLSVVDGFVIPLPTEMADYASTGRYLLQLLQTFATRDAYRQRQKVWNPVAIVHSRVRKGGADLIREFVPLSFGGHHMVEMVDDQPVISAAMSMMRSVYEIDSDVYDRRAILKAQEQYSALARSIMDLIEHSWADPACPYGGAQ